MGVSMGKNRLIGLCRARVVTALLLGYLILFSGYATAEMEFYSISEDVVIMYDAPSLKADKLFVANRFLPVEVVVEVDGWAKVRDSSGSLAWVEKKALSKHRYVVVTASLAGIHKAADADSELIFQAEQDSVLEWLDAEATGGVKVRHPDGQSGYVKVNQVWGS